MKVTYDFHTVLASEITIDREGRQRREIDDIDALASSIKRNGLINPIVITRDNKLVAGERRLTAWKELAELGMVPATIPVHYTDELSPIELQILELEENVKRKDMSWQDLVKASYNFHRICMEELEDWSVDKSAEALSVKRKQMYNYIRLGKEIESGNKHIEKAETLRTAINVVSRKSQREAEASLEKLNDMLLDPTVEVTVSEDGELEFVEKPEIDDGEEELLEIEEVMATKPIQKEDPFKEIDHVIHGNCIAWMESYTGPKFTFIHCDFPYGIDHDKSGKGYTWAWDKYDDSPEIYWGLTKALIGNLDKIASQSCHIMFWFPMKYYTGTINLFEKAGLKVDPYPLIWYKTDRAMNPDYRRLPSRAYEAALFITRGDPFIAKSVNNCFSSPVPKKSHPSEKPLPVLEHFFQLTVDEYTRILDPTCGSGNAISAGLRLGAERALGIELGEGFANAARADIRKYKNKD